MFFFLREVFQTLFSHLKYQCSRCDPVQYLLGQTVARQQFWTGRPSVEHEICAHCTCGYREEGGVSAPFIQRSESEHIIFTLELCFIARLSVDGTIIHLALIHDLDPHRLST